MINPSAAAVLSARIAYSTLHGLTLMIGAPRKNAASGLIPNADTKNKHKKQERPHFCGLFFCKSSRLLAVTSVLPLSISFFSRLCLPEPPHISDAWLAGTLCLIPKNPVEYLS